MASNDQRQAHRVGEVRGKTEERLSSIGDRAAEGRDRTYAGTQATKDKAVGTGEAAKEKAWEAKETAKQKAEEATQKAKQTSEQAAQNTSGALEETKEKVKQMAEGAKDAVKGTFGMGKDDEEREDAGLYNKEDINREYKY